MSTTAKPQDWIETAKWIWVPNYDDTVDPGRIVLFRKTFNIDASPTDECILHVSADTRYRLFINGTSVSFGPCKSYPSRWIYESIDIAPYLRKGINVLSVRVLRYSYCHAGNSSQITLAIPGLIVYTKIGDQTISSDETWKGIVDESVRIVTRKEWNYFLGPPFMANNENVDGREFHSLKGWQSQEYDDSQWSSAVVVTAKLMMMPIVEPRKLTARAIPMLPELPSRFHCANRVQGGTIDKSQWDRLFKEDVSVTIPAETRIVVDLQSDVLTTGFLKLDFNNGKDSTIKITCAESYEKPVNISAPFFTLKRFKDDRADFKNGELYGPSDTYTIPGHTSTYEPFWFRTFHYVRLEIQTAQDPLEILKFDYRETHYPLDLTTAIQTSSPEIDKIYKISLNTLRNCMHETYEDCPYYEQNQFAMDSRLQMLFSYQLSRDDRLARKTIQEFYASLRPDGLVETHYPVPFPAINIPQFSLFWILMIYDYMVYFPQNSQTVIRQYIGAVDLVLNYFHQLVNENGLVGRFDDDCWAFVDWVEEWKCKGPFDIKKMAVPPVYLETGVAAYNSLVYAMTLQHAAELCQSIGRNDTAREYQERAKTLTIAVNETCFDTSKQMYVDGPGVRDLCQHTQVFAVLSGCIEGEAAADLMRRTIASSEMAQCSFAMGFYIFRAVEKVGIYDEVFDTLLNPWRVMVKQNLTTWAESAVTHRSDCHGWSASPVYEIIAMIFGVRPGGVIAPRMDLLEEGQGKMVMPEGALDIGWTKEKLITLTAEQDMNVTVDLNGKRQNVKLTKGQRATFQ